MKRQLANIITCTRFLFSFMMLISKPFAVPFYIFYTAAAVSDILDGLYARKLSIESEKGAKLDSLADYTFAIVIMQSIIRNAKLPALLWWNIGILFLIRIGGMIVRIQRFQTASSFHSYANKLGGVLIIISPIFLSFLDRNIIFIVLCIVAYLASIDELLISLFTKKLDLNCRGILWELKERKKKGDSNEKTENDSV